MNYNWIKPNAKCRWNDPGIEDYDPKERKKVLLGEFTIVSVNGRDTLAENDDDIILISDGYSEAEVPASELVMLPSEKLKKDGDFIYSQMDALIRNIKATAHSAVKHMNAALKERNINHIEVKDTDIGSILIDDDLTLDSLDCYGDSLDVNYSNDEHNEWCRAEELDAYALFSVFNLVKTIVTRYDAGELTVDKDGNLKTIN